MVINFCQIAWDFLGNAMYKGNWCVMLYLSKRFQKVGDSDAD